jgi:hypothetical protein
VHPECAIRTSEPDGSQEEFLPVHDGLGIIDGHFDIGETNGFIALTGVGVIVAGDVVKGSLADHLGTDVDPRCWRDGGTEVFPQWRF